MYPTIIKEMKELLKDKKNIDWNPISAYYSYNRHFL